MPGAATDSSSGAIHTVIIGGAKNLEDGHTDVVPIDDGPIGTLENYGASRRPRPLTPRPQPSPFSSLPDPYAAARLNERVPETRVVQAQAGDVDMAAILYEASRKRIQQSVPTHDNDRNKGDPQSQTREIMRTGRREAAGSPSHPRTTVP